MFHRWVIFAIRSPKEGLLLLALRTFFVVRRADAHLRIPITSSSNFTPYNGNEDHHYITYIIHYVVHPALVHPALVDSNARVTPRNWQQHAFHSVHDSSFLSILCQSCSRFCVWSYWCLFFDSSGCLRHRWDGTGSSGRVRVLLWLVEASCAVMVADERIRRFISVGRNMCRRFGYWNLCVTRESRDDIFLFVLSNLSPFFSIEGPSIKSCNLPSCLPHRMSQHVAPQIRHLPILSPRLDPEMSRWIVYVEST